MDLLDETLPVISDDVDPYATEDGRPAVSESEKNLVKKVVDTIRQDKAHHKKSFDRMRDDMHLARYGRTKQQLVNRYTANLCGRHVKAKTAALYAKNPKAVARRRESMDFVIWDEKPESIQMAMQVLQTATAMMATAAPAGVDPYTGEPVMPMPTPEQEQAFSQAQATIEDFKQGMEKRLMITRTGKTLEILYAQALREQKPVDHKTGMKQLVRRAVTTGVGYVELGFQREYGPRPGMQEKLADFRSRLDHLRVLAEKTQEPEILPDDPEITELEMSIAALQTEQEVLVREGLIIDYPQSTKVIPDRLCRKLVGFIGARHVTLEYMFTADQVRELFDVDLGKDYVGYRSDGKSGEDSGSANIVVDKGTEAYVIDAKGSGLVCVWKHYDKASGLMYFCADGYPKFLREPSKPDVFVEDFWPVYALTFNDVESEEELFPLSDVRLMWDQQQDYNTARQGMREHRRAARPRWGYQNGLFEDADIERLKQMEAFEAVGFNLPEGAQISDIFQPIPVPGVDPNLYSTGEYFTDIQMVVGSSEAQFGGTAKATATESAIAANASASSDGSSVDDLDAFLTVIARASGQILLKEMSEEQVKRVVGLGAVWPHMTLAEIADEIYLEIEAGSSGKPNQAIEVANWEKFLPFLVQMPGISPVWIARETIRRLDDNADLTEALSEGVLSMVAQNGLAQAQANAGPPQPGTGDPTNDPASQGAEGASNAPQPGPTAGGSSAAFGSNQV